MKIKLLVLSMLAVTTVHAMPKNEGVLINSVTEYNVPMPDWMKKKIQVESQSASTQATANAAAGFHGQNVSASGNVSYQIYNSQPITENYWVDEWMCIVNNCTHTRNTIVLGSHLNANGSGMIYTSAVLNTPGSYQDSAAIQVTGVDNSYTINYNTVWIS